LKSGSNHFQVRGVRFFCKTEVRFYEAEDRFLDDSLYVDAKYHSSPNVRRKTQRMIAREKDLQNLEKWSKFSDLRHVTCIPTEKPSMVPIDPPVGKEDRTWMIRLYDTQLPPLTRGTTTFDNWDFGQHICRNRHGRVCCNGTPPIYPFFEEGYDDGRCCPTTQPYVGLKPRVGPSSLPATPSPIKRQIWFT